MVKGEYLSSSDRTGRTLKSVQRETTAWSGFCYKKAAKRACLERLWSAPTNTSSTKITWNGENSAGRKWLERKSGSSSLVHVKKRIYLRCWVMFWSGSIRRISFPIANIFCFAASLCKQRGARVGCAVCTNVNLNKEGGGGYTRQELNAVRWTGQNPFGKRSPVHSSWVCSGMNFEISSGSLGLRLKWELFWMPGCWGSLRIIGR